MVFVEGKLKWCMRDATDVTRWGVPEAKCTRRYGAISVQLLKNPELNSHAEHHKQMGTRLSKIMHMETSNLHFCLIK
jgi:hypothetical protein